MNVTKVLQLQVDRNLTPNSPATLGVPKSSVQYSGQLFTFNNGLIQLVSNNTPPLVLEQQPDNSVTLKPASGIPQQYWMRGHPLKNDSTETIDLPSKPDGLNSTQKFIGCNVTDQPEGYAYE